MEGIEERNKLFFCRNKEKNEFIFKTNGFAERVSFNIKEMGNGTDSFWKWMLTTLGMCTTGWEPLVYIMSVVGRPLSLRSQSFFFFFFTEDTVWKTLLHITTRTNIAVCDFFRSAFLDHLSKTKFYYWFHCIKIVTWLNKRGIYNFKPDRDVYISRAISSIKTNTCDIRSS